MKCTAISAVLLLVAGCSAATPPANNRNAAAHQPAPENASSRNATSEPAAPLGLRPEYQRCVDNAAGVVPDTQACIGVEFTYQEERLRAALDRKMHQADSGETSVAQAAWRKATDARCTWNAAEEGQGQRLEANACELEAIAARADELSK